MSSGTKVVTCGCRFNRFESAEVRALLDGKAPGPVVVINTCAVTKRSETKSRNLVRRAVRENPGAVIVVAGCWAELDPAAVRSLEGVDLVLGNEEKFRAAEFIKDPGPQKILTGAVNSAREMAGTGAAFMEGRTSAYLKMQNGCDETCSYCVVRLVRGKGRSAPPETLLEAARGLIAGGAREIVLTGINVGRYGDGRPGGHNLAALVEQLTALGHARLRISSINPLDVSPALITLLERGGALCRHLHIPLQSGSGRILKMMERPYTTAEYRRVAEEVAQRVPGIAIGCDIMAGFPGETDADFAQSLQMLESLPFSYAHIFSYSPRPGTKAAAMPDSVPEAEKRRRVVALKKAAARKNLIFRHNMAGRDARVLVERYPAGGGKLSGKTDSFVQASFKGPATLAGTLVNVRIERATADGVEGVLV